MSPVPESDAGLFSKAGLFSGWGRGKVEIDKWSKISYDNIAESEENSYDKAGKQLLLTPNTKLSGERHSNFHNYL